MLGNGLRRDYMGRYISQDWLKIKQLVAVLRPWVCGKNHFVVLDLNYVFVQDHGLWHQKDPKNKFSVFSTRHRKFVLQSLKKGRQMSPKRRSLGIMSVSPVWAGWSWNEGTSEESAAMLLAELLENKQTNKKKPRLHTDGCVVLVILLRTVIL